MFSIKNSWIFTIVRNITILLHFVQSNQGIAQQIEITAVVEKKVILIEDDGNPTRDLCPDQGIHVERVRIQLQREYTRMCPEEWYKELTNNTLNLNEKNLVKSIKRECNGKPQCELQQSWNVQTVIKCNDLMIPTHTLKIYVKCLPITVDNISVFDIKSITDASIKGKFNIISRDHDVFQICHLSGNGNITNVQLLHLEFYNNDRKDTKDTEKNNLVEIFSIKDKHENKLELISTASFTELDKTNVSMEDGEIQIFMNSGFIWMQIEADNFSRITCRHWEGHYGTYSVAFTVFIVLSVFLLASIATIVVLGCKLKKRKTKSGVNIYNLTNDNQQDDHHYSETVRTTQTMSEYDETNDVGRLEYINTVRPC